MDGASNIDIRPHAWAALVLMMMMMALLLLVGCGSAGATSSGTSTSKLCQSVAAVNQALTQLSTAGDNTTVGEVKAIQQKLTPALDALANLPNGGGSTLSNLKSANDQLATAIKDLPDSATVGQVGPRFQDLRSKASQAQAAVTKLSSTLHCTS